jgi:hypothetical protein
VPKFSSTFDLFERKQIADNNVSFAFSFHLSINHSISFLSHLSRNNNSDNFKKSFMKACLCSRGKDIKAQLNVENSIFPRFGRSRGSEKLTSIAKNNFQKPKATGGAVDSEAVVLDRDNGKHNVCIKTTAITIPSNFENKEHNNINGLETTSKGQRTRVLHTDL